MAIEGDLAKTRNISLVHWRPCELNTPTPHRQNNALIKRWVRLFSRRLLFSVTSATGIFTMIYRPPGYCNLVAIVNYCVVLRQRQIIFCDVGGVRLSLLTLIEYPHLCRNKVILYILLDNGSEKSIGKKLRT